jgi:RNA polymerase sigma-70 factor, ECF subfamily
MGWMPDWTRADERLSDEQLMHRVRTQGDHAAFTRLVNRWQVPIRRLCIRMTGDEHRGEDLAQDGFARVFANRHQFDDTRRFSTWLWRIALNLCYAEGRSNSRRRQPPVPLQTDDVNAADSGPHERAVESERAALVREALSRLPESHRAVVVLREYEGLKFREIADVLDVPEGTAKWRMSEALDELSRQLTPVMTDDADEDTPRPPRDAGPKRVRVML